MRTVRSIRSSRTGLGLAALAALALASAGCGAITEQVTEQVVENAMEESGGGDVEIDRSSGEITMETPEGTTVIGGGEIPPAIADLVDLPGDFVVEGTLVTSGDGAGSLVAGRMKGDIDEVAADFTEDLEAGGWTIDSTFDGGDTIVIAGSRDDQTVTVSVTADTSTDDLIVQVILG